MTPRHREHPRVEPPPGFAAPWLRSDRPLPRLVARPLEQFLRLESGSASLLLAAAVAALVWANAAQGSYESFWATNVRIEIGSLKLEEDLLHVVNDLFMALFFFVVALEVKREARFGSLRDRRSAAIPIAAAIGTMVGGAAVYIAVNVDGGNLRGWAVPIATDIAFALGALGVVGRKAPAELRAFMLTLAVVDDLGTILVIALFYSSGIALGWLAAAVLLVLAVILLNRLAVRSLTPYVLLAGALWICVFESGVHATIAGVVLGFLTPATAFYARRPTGEAIAGQLDDIVRASDRDVGEGTLMDTARLAREGVSPLARLETQLHPWSAYAVLPLFALANAGVPISLDGIGDALTSQVGIGIALGLVVGAPLGGLLLSWATTRLTPGRLPDGLDWPAIAGVAPLKGIGFTVAIFISLLAFDTEAAREQAKLSILLASAIAGIIGVIVLLARNHLMRSAIKRDLPP
jgi:NhaA family Na+:H+ antiporter